MFRYTHINDLIQLTLSDIEREKTYQLMAITHTRIQNGHAISTDETLLELEMSAANKKALSTVTKAIYSFYERNYALSDSDIVNEVKYFVTIINTVLLDYTNPAVTKETYSILETNDTDGYRMTLALLDIIHNKLGYNLSTYRYLVLKLTKIHTHLLFFSGLPTIYHLDNMNRYYKKEYPVAVHLLSLFINHLLSSAKIEDSSQNRTYLMTHYLPLLSNYLHFYDFNRKVAITLVCSLPYLIENEIKHKLMNSFTNKITFTTVDSCDLIITEFPIEQQPSKQLLFDYPLTHRGPFQTKKRSIY